MEKKKMTMKVSMSQIGLGNYKSDISCTAVRETGVSRHHRDTIKGHPEIPRTPQHYEAEEFSTTALWG